MPSVAFGVAGAIFIALWALSVDPPKDMPNLFLGFGLVCWILATTVYVWYRDRSTVAR
jgi:hypothetical protein